MLVIDLFGQKAFQYRTDKNQNSKRYSFANVKSFWHLMWKTFCHSGRENSIKTNLEACNLWTGQYVSFKSVNLFWLNLPHQNGKTFFTSNVKNFSHLQMDIFCYFNFCHCRRNNFCAVDLFIGPIIFMIFYQSCGAEYCPITDLSVPKNSCGNLSIFHADY